MFLTRVGILYYSMYSRRTEILRILKKYVPIALTYAYVVGRFIYTQTRISYEWLDHAFGDSRGGRLMALGIKMLPPTGLLVLITGFVRSYAYDAVALHGVAWIFVFLGLALYLEDSNPRSNTQSSTTHF